MMEAFRIKKEVDPLSIDKEDSDSEASVIVDFCPQDINPPSIAVKRENETEQDGQDGPSVLRRNLRKRNPVQVNIELPSESDEETKQKKPKKRGGKEMRATKKSAGKPKSKKNKTDGSDIGLWALDAKKKVAVRTFKGQTYIDIREFWMNDEGIQLPGKKGIALTPPAWNKLKTLVTKIDEALKKVNDDDD